MKKMFLFVRQSIEELKKVSWPTKEETFRSSFVVLCFIFIFSIFLFCIDYVANLLIQGLVK